MKTKKNIKFYMLFVFFSNLNIMSSFLSLYLSDIGLSLSLVSSVFLLYQATKFLLEVPTGYVADRYGRKFSGILGMILMILSYLLLLTMNNQAITAYIFVFIQALGYTFISGSVESLFVDSIDNELLVHWNAVERIIFYFALALSSVMGYKLPVNQRNILFALYLIDFAKAFSYVGVQDLYALYLQQFGLTSNIIGIIIAFQFVISSLFGLLTPNLQKYMRNETLLYVLPAIQVIITIPAYALNINVWIVPFLYILQSIIFSLYAPVKYQLFQKNLDTSFRARALSFQSIMISMGSILFYGFSSIAGRYLALSHTVTIALVITLLLILVSSGILSKSDF